MRAYSIDLRKRVSAMSDAGRRTHEVAKAFGVSESWIRRLKKGRGESGEIAQRAAGGRRNGHFDAIRLAQLEEWLRERPDATLEALPERVRTEWSLRCSLMGAYQAIRKLGWSIKKRCGPANAIARTCCGIEITS